MKTLASGSAPVDASESAPVDGPPRPGAAQVKRPFPNAPDLGVSTRDSRDSRSRLQAESRSGPPRPRPMVHGDLGHSGYWLPICRRHCRYGPCHTALPARVVQHGIVGTELPALQFSDWAAPAMCPESGALIIVCPLVLDSSIAPSEKRETLLLRAICCPKSARLVI
jgi:hypothetical protein